MDLGAVGFFPSRDRNKKNGSSGSIAMIPVLCRPYGALVALSCITLLGCGGVKTYPVAGTVTWLDGTPAKELATGMVQFDLITDDSKGKKFSPQGGIQNDGTYRLGTFKPGDGAPAGKYRVLVMPHHWTEGELADKPAPPPVLDPRFQQFETAKIEVEVKAQSNDIPIKVEKAKKR